MCVNPMGAIAIRLLRFLLLSSAALLHSPRHVSAADRSSLLEFKSAISLDPHGALVQWNDTVHFCIWYGVACSHKHPERIVALQLTSLDLVGTVSPALANLTFLTALDLSSNRFHGRIPQELGRLPRLQTLDLGRNSLDGIIPPELSRCKRLRILTLHYNQLEGSIPSELGSLPSLYVLSLKNNSITGQIPATLANISSLSQLKLGHNRLSGRIPPSLGRLSGLADLELGFNNIQGLIPSALWNLSSLRNLSLESNQIRGSLPPDIGKSLPNLEIISVAYNEMHGEIPRSFPNASRIYLVQLPGNNFRGTIPENLGSLRYLLHLLLYDNQLEAREPRDWNFLASLHNCTMLERLDLGQNDLRGSLPKSLANLSTTLQYLSLANNYIEGSIPQDIGNLVSLRVLDMGPNMLTGSVPISIGLLKDLRVLDLGNNSLSNEIPSSLGNLTEIVLLYLELNSFNGSIPASFGSFVYLNLLSLGHNKLTGTIPKEVIGLSSLTQGISLVENMLTGSIPPEIGNLTNSGTILLSGNKLSGEIPSSLSKCQLLEVLHLDRNMFRGSIPTSLSALAGLRQLDLSHNSLSGRIPVFLGDLHLNYLNLSFNNFEGEVPTNGVFANMSAFSVIGNNKLCGGNTTLHLSICSSPTTKKKSHKLAVIISVTTSVACLSLLSCLVAAHYWRKRKPTSKTSANNNIKDQYINVSYADLVKATNGFSQENLIGSGNFGSVYQGKLDDHEQGTKVVAVKVFNLQQLGALKSFTTECDALRNIRHRNLVKVLGACSSVDFRGNDFKAMIFEYMANGSLERWLHSEENNCKLNLVQRLNIAIDVASALEYLHHHGKNPIVHCDLKPSNILLDDDMMGHLTDFGLARFTKNSNQSSTSSLGMKGTVGYIAPEYGVANRVSTHGDVYSYGILLMELFTGKRPTDDVFKEGLSLRTFIEMAIPERLVDVIDVCMKAEDDGEESCLEIPDAKYIDCIASVLQIALVCTKDLPKERMEMDTINRELDKVRKSLLGN